MASVVEAPSPMDFQIAFVVQVTGDVGEGVRAEEKPLGDFGKPRRPQLLVCLGLPFRYEGTRPRTMNVSEDAMNNVHRILRFAGR